MKNVSKKIVALISAAAMMSTFFVSAQAEDAGSYDPFAGFSTYNLGASQWGKDPSTAGGVTVTDIEGGKKVTLDNTIAKVQFNPATGAVPTGYEWYTVTGSVMSDNDLAFENVPYIYEGKEISNTNVVSIGYREGTGNDALYTFRASSNVGDNIVFRGNFSDWVNFKYVIHNSADKTTVYAFYNDNYIGYQERATKANGIGSMIFQTRSDGNHSGSVYVKDLLYTWGNDAVSIPNEITVDNRLMNGLQNNLGSYPGTATISYNATEDAIQFYSSHKNPLLRFLDPQTMSVIPQGASYYKQSFKVKRDANFGPGTIVLDVADHKNNSACWFVMYRKRNWNQLQVKANTAEANGYQVGALTGYKDELDWTQFDVYLDSSSNLLHIFINGVEQYTVVPKVKLLDLQYMQLSINDMESSYTGTDTTASPIQYYVKDYSVAWGEHDLRYKWQDDDSIELVNANITGVAIDASIGGIPEENLDQVSILNTKTGATVPVTGSSSTGDIVYLDAELENDVEYLLTVNGGIEGIGGVYTGDTYSKGFKIKKVYEQLGTDWEGNSSTTRNAITNIGDVYFVSATIPYTTVGNTKISNYENFTQIYDYVPYRHYSNTRTWSNTNFYTTNGNKLELQQNTNGEAFGDVKVAGASRGGVTLKTPLGMECVEMGRDSANNPDGCLKYFTDASGNQITTPTQIKTHQEVYTVSNDAFRVYSDVSGDMKLAYAYYDEADQLSNSGYVQMQASGRMLFGLKRVTTTIPEFFDVSNDDITDTALINASRDGVVLTSSIGSIYGTAGISVKNAETGASVEVTGTSAAGKNIYIDAQLDTDTVYQVSLAKGVQGRNGTIAEGFTKYFKISDVEGVDTIDAIKNRPQGTDEYGDYYSMYNCWATTQKQYENVTVTIKAQRFGAHGYGTYSNELIKRLDTKHNYMTVYHSNKSDGVFGMYVYTYDSAQNKLVGAWGDKDIICDSTTMNGVFKTESASTDSNYVPVYGADGLPVIVTNSAPYVEKINFSGNVLKVSYNDSEPYTYVDKDNFFPQKGNFGFEASVKGVAKLYDFVVTTMETVEPSALNIEAVSANANGINVKFSGNVDAVNDYSAITLEANGTPVATNISAVGSKLTIAPTGGMVSGAIYTLEIAEGFGNLFSATASKYSKTFRVNVYANSVADATITGTQDDLGDGVIFTGNLGIDSEEMANADDYTVEFNYTPYLALNDSADFDEEWNYDTEVPQTMVYTTASSANAAPVNGSYFQFTKTGVELWKNTASNGSKVADGASVNTKYGDAYAGEGYADLLVDRIIAVIPLNTDFEALGYDFYDGSEGLVNQTIHSATTYAMKVVKAGNTVTLYRDGAKVGEITDAQNGYFGIEASALEFVGISDLMAYSVEDIDGIIPTLDKANGKVVLANYGAAKSVVVVVATYNNAGAMVDSDIISVNAAAGNTDVAYTVSTEGATKYGVMVWDSLSTLNPIADKLNVLK